MIGCDAIEQCMGTASVFTGIAAKGAGALAAGIWHVVETPWIERYAQMQIDETRLDNGAQIIEIDFKNTIHTCKDDHDTAIDGDCAAAEAGTRTAWHDRYAIASRYLHDLCHILAGCRQNDDIRGTAINRGVILVEGYIVG